MGLLDFLKPKGRMEPPLTVPPRGPAWHPNLDVEPSTGHVVVWPAAGRDGISACFDPQSSAYHSAIVFGLGDLPAGEPVPPSPVFLEKYLLTELEIIGAAFGLKTPAAFDAAKPGLRKIDFLEANGQRSDYYEFAVTTRSWIGPENHDRKTFRSLESHGTQFAGKQFLVPKTYTLRAHHDLTLEGLLRVTVPTAAGDRRVLLGIGFGSKFVEGYLEADNWPKVKPEVSGFLYGTEWRLK